MHVHHNTTVTIQISGPEHSRCDISVVYGTGSIPAIAGTAPRRPLCMPDTARSPRGHRATGTAPRQTRTGR
jgi:hypothetical protein